MTTFKAITTWQPVELDSEEISDGVFTISNQGDNLIQFIKATSTPTEEEGESTIRNDGDWVKYELVLAERLYCITAAGTARMGVVKS